MAFGIWPGGCAALDTRSARTLFIYLTVNGKVSVWQIKVFLWRGNLCGVLPKKPVSSFEQKLLLQISLGILGMAGK